MWPPAGMASSDLLPIRPGGGPPPWAVQGAGPCILQPQLRGGAGLFWLQMKFKGLKGLPHLSYLVTLVPQSRLAFSHHAHRLAIGPLALAKPNPTVCILTCRWQL